MNALRTLLILVAISIIGCAGRPPATSTATSVATAKVVTPATAAPAPAVATVEEKRSMLAELVLRIRPDVKDVVVFTTRGKASEAAAALERAGLTVSFANVSLRQASDRKRTFNGYDLGVVEGRPDDAGAHAAASLASERFPIVATWKGSSADTDAAIELTSTSGAETTHFAVWGRRSEDAPVRLEGLGLRAPVAPGVVIGEDGVASVTGQLYRLENGKRVIEADDVRTRNDFVLEGPLGDALSTSATSDDRFVAIASVRGRMVLDEVVAHTSVWSLEVDAVDVHLDERAVRTLTARHAKLYDRAVGHVRRGELALAANDLELAAKVFDDALGGRGWVGSRFVRFDRTMARRIREVATEGASAEALIDRVASFETNDMVERDLIEAVTRLARAKTLRDYRTARDDDAAERAANLFFRTVGMLHEPFPAVCVEMSRRFASLRDGGDYHKRTYFYREGDPVVF